MQVLLLFPCILVLYWGLYWLQLSCQGLREKLNLDQYLMGAFFQIFCLSLPAIIFITFFKYMNLPGGSSGAIIGILFFELFVAIGFMFLFLSQESFYLNRDKLLRNFLISLIFLVGLFYFLNISNFISSSVFFISIFSYLYLCAQRKSNGGELQRPYSFIAHGSSVGPISVLSIFNQMIITLISILVVSIVCLLLGKFSLAISTGSGIPIYFSSFLIGGFSAGFAALAPLLALKLKSIDLNNTEAIEIQKTFFQGLFFKISVGIILLSVMELRVERFYLVESILLFCSGGFLYAACGKNRAFLIYIGGLFIFAYVGLIFYLAAYSS